MAETGLGPRQILGLAKALELKAGRLRTARFGPRMLDIDLLLFDDLRVEEPELQLPHPRLRERRFFLAPLAAIAPHLQLPPDGVTVAETLAALGDEQPLEEVPWSRQPSY